MTAMPSSGWIAFCTTVLARAGLAMLAGLILWSVAPAAFG
jgi:hypothetical protein